MRLGKIVIFLLILSGSTSSRLAEAKDDDSWLHIGPLHGDFGLSYEKHDSNSRVGTNESEKKYYFLYEEVNLKNRMFIYDPRFIELSLGGGFRLGQGHGDREGEDTTITRYNISANILKRHPYRGSLYFRKFDAEYEHSPSAITVVEQKDTGAGLALQEDALGLPIPLNFNYRSTQRENENIFEHLDLAGTSNRVLRFQETTDSFDISSQKRWKNVFLSWKLSNKDFARSQVFDGIPAEIEYRETNFHTSAAGKAGERDRFRWKINFNRRSQTDHPKISDSDLDEEVRFKIFDTHASSLDTILSAAISEKERQIGSIGFATTAETQKIDSTRVLGGFDHRLFKSLYSQLKMKSEKTTFPDNETDIRELFVGTRYTKQIPDGNINASYSLSIRNEETSGEVNLFVSNEFHIMIDFLPVTLAADNIVLGSIVVTEGTETIVYQEGVDYRVQQVGLKTQIERIPGTSILNGAPVLVDYEFIRPRRSFEEVTRRYSLRTKWMFMEPYIRVLDREQNLLSGSGSLLNPGKSTIRGLTLRHSFWGRVTPEFNIESERNTFAQDPFDRAYRRGSLTVAITDGMSSAINFSRTEIDRNDSNNDTDQSDQGFTLVYARGRVKGSLRIRKEDSTLGETERETFVFRTGITVFYGQWTLDTFLGRAQENFIDLRVNPPSEFESESLVTKIELKRRF